MGTAERRIEIMRTLCKRKFETVSNLAFEFGVSERTIRRDVQALSLSEPIYTQTGRYNGGVYVLDNYSISKMYFSDNESKIMRKIYDVVCGNSSETISDDELAVFKRIVSNYTKPTIRK